ncbi:MAG: hypothetical protein M1358_10430 [Chloroflexi bacterium]|nr:hypothetical protein [Chloroflexota bacterium]
MKRYEREIEEILQKIVDFPADGEARRRAMRRSPSLWSRARHRLCSVRPMSIASNLASNLRIGSNLVVAAIAMTILGFALREYAPRLAPFVSLLAVALFVMVFFRSFQRRRPRYEKRWRGEIIEFPRKKTNPWTDLRFSLTIMWRNFRRWIGWR